VSKEIKVALLAIVAIAALIFGYNFLRGSNLLSSDRTFFATYANVDGLNVGSPVIFNGIKVGQVKQMELMPADNNRVKVSLELQKDIVVGDSTVASLSGSLLGSKALPVMGTVDSTLTKLNGFLNKDAKRSLQATLVNAEGTTEALKNLIIQNQRNINEITTNMAALTRALSGSSKKLDKIAVDFGQLSDSLKNAPVGPALRRLNATMGEAQTTMTSLNRALTDQKGSLGKLINDTLLYNNLTTTASSADALLMDVKANPKRYVHFSVFGGGKSKTEVETKTTKPSGTKVETEVKTTSK
jgi:phospholipid/cholesterol/gamma-HCH transport system substrate-binding protein